MADTKQSMDPREDWSKKQAEKDQVFKTWAPSFLFVADCIIFLVVCVAMGVSSSEKITPWKISVFRLENFNLISDATVKFISVANWNQNMTNAQIYSYVARLSDDLYIPTPHDTVHPFSACVILKSTSFVRDLLGRATLDDVKELKKSVWDCSRMFAVPMQIIEMTKINLLLSLFIWTSVALMCRGFAMFTLTDRKDQRMWFCAMSAMIISVVVGLGAFGYGMYEASHSGGDMSMTGVILMFVLILSLLWTSWTGHRHGAQGINDVNIKDGERWFSASWLIVGVMKPITIAPIYVLIILSLSGVSDFYALLFAIFLTFVLCLLSSTLSYYNLYATHRHKAMPVVTSSSAGSDFDDQGQGVELNYVTESINAADTEELLSESSTLSTRTSADFNGKSKRPANVIAGMIVCVLAVSFTSWPKRRDLETFWDDEFSIFFLMFGLIAMIVPDIMFFTRYNSAMNVREQGEILFRVFVTLIVLSFVF